MLGSLGLCCGASSDAQVVDRSETLAQGRNEAPGTSEHDDLVRIWHGRRCVANPDSIVHGFYGSEEKSRCKIFGMENDVLF